MIVHIDKNGTRRWIGEEAAELGCTVTVDGEAVERALNDEFRLTRFSVGYVGSAAAAGCQDEIGSEQPLDLRVSVDEDGNFRVFDYVTGREAQMVTKATVSADGTARGVVSATIDFTWLRDEAAEKP